MSTPTTGQRRDARGLLGRMFVGGPPKKPPGRARSALILVASVAWCVLTVLSWGTTPRLMTLAVFCVVLCAVLGTLGQLASYHRWRGEHPGWLLRLSSGLFSLGFLILLLSNMVLMGMRTGQWGWLWWAAFALGLTAVVGVAGHYYGPEDRPESEGGTSAGRGPSN